MRNQGLEGNASRNIENNGCISNVQTSKVSHCSEAEAHKISDQTEQYLICPHEKNNFTRNGIAYERSGAESLKTKKNKGKRTKNQEKL